jgi:rare lipoprotein A (peptidoglycan hydrolase)
MSERAARAKRAEDAYDYWWGEATRRAPLRAIEGGASRPGAERPPVRAEVERPRRRADRPHASAEVPRIRPTGRDAGVPGRRTVQIDGRGPARRRRPVTATAVGGRPDRVALWAVLLGLLLVLISAGTARAERYSHHTLGARTLHKGDAGFDVRTLQRVLRMKGYGVGGVDGRFGRRTHRAVKRFQRRRRLRADGVVGSTTTRALASSWRPRMATWYGPGLYGNRTACGRVLGHRTRGVAHRSLRCGRVVAVYHRGRIMVLPVIDRGPFHRGVAFDITHGAARRLGVRATVGIRAGY